MNSPAAMPAEGSLRRLLEELLAQTQRAGDTPLRFGLDTDEIVRTALATQLGATSSGLSDALNDPPAVVNALDSLVAAALGGEQASSAPRNQPDPASLQGALTAWLGWLRAVAQSVHPDAIEILARRLEGCDDCDIALRLGLGPRLVGRLVAELREQWAAREREAVQP